ncbi:MAG: sulfate adenylyltransferase [Acidobacteria bacterium]|nr:MAG: sulfate adenylyltransferase [Acidobacteriota bacterium]
MSGTIRENKDSVELLRFFTCGSVDDGKSTLIGRLLHDSKLIFEDQLEALSRASLLRGETEVNLANLTDGLRAEREQGITIDVAYRYFATAKRRFIVADTPGHVQYTRNMVTGASTASLALILVDARKGVVEQTRRHSCIASLLGIPHLVLCVNKMDLVAFSQEIFNQIRHDFTIFSTRLRIRDITFIPLSARFGDNVVERSVNMPWYQGASLLSFLEDVHIASDLNLQDARFPVQWVIRPQSEEYHDFRAVAGQIASGVFKIGENIMVLPSGRRSKIKDISLAGKSLKVAYAPMSVSLLLEDEIDISRGDIIVPTDNLPYFGNDAEAMICWMHEIPLHIGRKYIVKHTTQTTKGVIKNLHCRINIDSLEEERASLLELNEIGRVSLKTATPLIYDEYYKNRSLGGFIVIDEATHATVGAGMFFEPTKAPPVPEYVDYAI